MIALCALLDFYVNIFQLNNLKEDFFQELKAYV